MRSKSRNRSSPCITVVCSPKWPYLKLSNDHFAIRKVRGICCRRQNLVQFSYYIHPCTRVTLRCQLDDSTIELNYLRLRVLVFNSTATFTLNDPVWSGLGGFWIQNLKCMLYIKIQTQLANPHARKGDTQRRVSPSLAWGWFSRTLAFRSLYYPWSRTNGGLLVVYWRLKWKLFQHLSWTPSRFFYFKVSFVIKTLCRNIASV